MKTFVLICLAASLPAAWGLAQGTAVFDESVWKRLADVNNTITAGNVTLGQLLDKADKQLQAMQQSSGDTTAIRTATESTARDVNSLLQRLGDPNAIRPARFDDLKNKVQDWINNGVLPPPPSYDKDIKNPTSSGDGDQAFFKATAGGLFDAITDKFKPDPTKDDKKPRDPKLYTGAVDELAAVNQYYQVREAALNRRTDLQQLLSDTLNEIKDATDFATLEKLTALVNLIENQLKACNDDINSAFNDVAVRGVQMFAMSQIKSAADNEALAAQLTQKGNDLTDMKGKTDPSSVASASSSASGTSGSATSGFLPWIPYHF